MTQVHNVYSCAQMYMFYNLEKSMTKKGKMRAQKRTRREKEKEKKTREKSLRNKTAFLLCLFLLQKK